ncbi:ATPase [Eubacteriales bacterium OttesenSCG-928-G02]|nr:ATPase [Eubacteriales bacterium OttesenSCG-928-G02]
MAIQKVTLIKASGSIDKLDHFLTACRRSGEFHPEHAGVFLSESMGFTPLNEQNKYESYLKSIIQLVSLTGSSFLKNVEAQNHSSEEISLYLEKFKTDIGNLIDEQKLLNEQLELCLAGIERFKHFTGLDIPLEEIFSCEYISVRFGRLPKTQLSRLRSYDSNPYVLFIPCSEDEEFCWGVYFAPKVKKDEVDRIFAFLYFDRIDVPGAAGPPSRVIEELQENIVYINERLGYIKKQLTDYWKNNEELCSSMYATLKWHNNLFEFRKYAAVKNEQFYYFCWIPTSALASFKQNIDGLDVVYEAENPDKKGTQAISPPVKIKNLKAFRPFEMFVKMYGLPSYDGMDITAFVAITYTLLFGIMFGDLGQGFVLIIAGFVMWKLMHMDLGKILIPCGFSAMIFGTLYGSVFGYEHMLNPLFRAIGFKEKPFEIMDNITNILIFAIAIGVVLLVISMILNVVMNIRIGNYIEALIGHNGVVGIILYIFGVLLVVGFMSGNYIIPIRPSAVVMVLCAVILFFKELIEIKLKGEKIASAADYVMQNLFEVLEYILSYFSNTVSFLRVGAFVLVHAGMMMVVFSLAGDGNLFVVILGNALVICLEGLVTGIQALRLEFYEMFSRFYQGDGKAFVMPVNNL